MLLENFLSILKREMYPLIRAAAMLVVKAMASFPQQEDLQEIALATLVGLLQGDSKCKQTVREAGALLSFGSNNRLEERFTAVGEAGQVQVSSKMMNNTI